MSLEVGKLEEVLPDVAGVSGIRFMVLMLSACRVVSWPTPVHAAHDEDGENSHQPRLGTKLASGPQLVGGRLDFQDGARGLAAADCESVDGSLEKIPSDVQTNRGGKAASTQPADTKHDAGKADV